MIDHSNSLSDTQLTLPDIMRNEFLGNLDSHVQNPTSSHFMCYYFSWLGVSAKVLEMYGVVDCILS